MNFNVIFTYLENKTGLLFRILKHFDLYMNTNYLNLLQDLTLQELLDQENIIQELKSQNKKLVDL